MIEEEEAAGSPYTDNSSLIWALQAYTTPQIYPWQSNVIKPHTHIYRTTDIARITLIAKEVTLDKK